MRQSSVCPGSRQRIRKHEGAAIMSRSMKKTLISRPACLVCNDWSYGRHYGIPACSACSSFFKRTIRQRLTYKCVRGTGSCVLDKVRRNQCQSCRLKKCLEMGMNPNAVQVERRLGGRHAGKFHLSSTFDQSVARDDIERTFIHLGIKQSSITITPFSEEASTVLTTDDIKEFNNSDNKVVPGFFIGSGGDEKEHSAFNKSHKQKKPLENAAEESIFCQSSISPTKCLRQLERDPKTNSNDQLQAIIPVLHHPTQSSDEQNSSSVNHNDPGISISTSISYELADSSNLSPSTPLLAERNLSLSLDSVPNSALVQTTKTSVPFFSSPWVWKEDTAQHETATLLLLREVKWARKLPGFLGLSFCDQIILLEESWNELFLLSTIEHCFFATPGSSILLSPSLKAPIYQHVCGGANNVSSTHGDSREMALCYIRKLVGQFRDLQMDHTEMSFLKGAILFKPFVRGLKNPLAVQELLDETLSKASDHHRLTGSKQRLMRFFHFLLRLPVLLRIPSKRLEQIYFSSIGGMTMEKFLVNMLMHPVDEN